uniref:Candidate secreted effector n=1 Tax=Meloidogyne incognita TaxID=6306 RepID=A0A914LY38_MELIC
MVHVWVVIELSSHQSVHVHVHLSLFSIDVRHSRVNFLFFLLPLRLIGWQIFVFFISQQHIILVTDGLPCSFMKFTARVDALRWFVFGWLVFLGGDVPLRVVNVIRQMFRAVAVFLHLDGRCNRRIHLDLLRSV